MAAAVINSEAIPTAAAIAIAIVLDFLVASLTMVAVGMSIITWIVVNARMGVVVAIAFGRHIPGNDWHCADFDLSDGDRDYGAAAERLCELANATPPRIH